MTAPAARPARFPTFDLELGLSTLGVVLLALTLLVASLTLGTGRTTVVQALATW